MPVTPHELPLRLHIDPVRRQAHHDRAFPVTPPQAAALHQVTLDDLGLGMTEAIAIADRKNHFFGRHRLDESRR